MTKKELVASLVEDNSFSTKAYAERTINAIFGKIEAALLKGETAEITGFGKFEVIERAEKKGRNPQTGEDIVIPASKTVKFRVSKTLKDKVN